MRAFRLFFVFCLLICSALMTACGPSNTVSLLAPNFNSTMLARPTAPSIAVVQFADNRADPESLGTRRDNSFFTTPDNVSEWVSTAAAQTLTARGYKVTYAKTPEQASMSHPDYLLTGAVEEVKLHESSTTSFDTNMRVHFVLSSRTKKLKIETLYASQQRTAMPSSTACETLLRNTLLDIVEPLADKVSQTIGK